MVTFSSYCAPIPMHDDDGVQSNKLNVASDFDVIQLGGICVITF